MPDQPPGKLHRPRRPTGHALSDVPTERYFELHCKTNLSFLEGASHPDELVAEAVRLGYAGLAVTDRNSLSGVVRAHSAAGESGLKLVIGAEVTLVDAAPIVLWAMDRGGYGRLCRLLTHGRRQAPKGECRLSFQDVAAHAEGLLIGVLLATEGDLAARLARWRHVFLDRTYAVAELRRDLGDDRRFGRWQDAALDACVPIVYAGDVHYHHPRRRYLQDVLTAIRLKTTVAALGAALPQRRAVPASGRRHPPGVPPVFGGDPTDGRGRRPLRVFAGRAAV